MKNPPSRPPGTIFCPVPSQGTKKAAIRQPRVAEAWPAASRSKIADASRGKVSPGTTLLGGRVKYAGFASIDL